MQNYSIKTTYTPGSSKAWLGYPQDASTNISAFLTVTQELIDKATEDGVIYSGLPVVIANGEAKYSASTPIGFLYNDIVLEMDNIKDELVGKVYAITVVVSGAVYVSKLPYDNVCPSNFLNLEAVGQ